MLLTMAQGAAGIFIVKNSSGNFLSVNYPKQRAVEFPPLIFCHKASMAALMALPAINEPKLLGKTSPE